MIVQYICAECSKHFSAVECIHERKADRRITQCPFCGCLTLVLVHRETWDTIKQHKERDML